MNNPLFRLFQPLQLSAALLWLASLSLLFSAVQAQTTASPAAPMTWQAVQKQDASKRVTMVVTFEKVDADGYIILNYGSVSLKTRLAGLKVNGKLAGVLGMYLPAGARLKAEMVEKGAVQSVVLWKNGTNLNEQLMIDGVAVGLR